NMKPIDTRILAGIQVPATPVIDQATEYARQKCEPYLFNHVVRSCDGFRTPARSRPRQSQRRAGIRNPSQIRLPTARSLTVPELQLSLRKPTTLAILRWWSAGCQIQTHAAQQKSVIV